MLPAAPAAALVVGRRPHRHVFFFLLRDGWVLEELDFALNTLRAALGSRLQDERVRGNVKEAAEIQQSLLLDEPPAFPGYELACRSLAAEEVGGDFYDFLPFGNELLGLAIGDASGHGLPAALLVRDVVTGLRMGLEKDLKIAYVFGKLNRVIHRSNLSSRFVSVFYGELESDGTLIYVNAGHQPPLIFAPSGETSELRTGGTVIGPLREARFRRGFGYLPPGGVMVAVTDGILERRDEDGEFFGEERLKVLVRMSLALPAQLILERLVGVTFAFGAERPWEDDATVVVVKRRH
jgi:sigma-B regulation protein RsbU (phosphoserine phosphatase)